MEGVFVMVLCIISVLLVMILVWFKLIRYFIVLIFMFIVGNIGLYVFYRFKKLKNIKISIIFMFRILLFFFFFMIDIVFFVIY